MPLPPQPLGDTCLLTDAPVSRSADGVLDVVNAFGVTAVHFDPARTSGERLTEQMARSGSATIAPGLGRTIEISTVFDGDDLEAVACRAGWSVGEVVERFTQVTHTVGAVGFQPGFAYLEGLPAELHTQRRDSPRARVPAGSIAIGGPYAGVYPGDSPGGWNLLGRTPLVMWDENRDRPSLLTHGDRVRFRAINQVEFSRLAKANAPATGVSETPVERPLLRVIRPGVQTTIQGVGRFGRQHLGVSPGGAMDTTSLRLANLLVGNDTWAPALEATLIGPVLEAIEPVTLGVAGAVEATRRVRLGRGERLDLRRLVGGARAYVALPGGVLGSTEADGLVGSLDPGAIDHCKLAASQGWSLPTAANLRGNENKAATLRVLRGPQASAFDDESWGRLLNATYRVSPNSNRMGVRCEGPALTRREASPLPSQPVVTGAIQVPPDGEPIVLGADRQTLGGYPIIAAVVSADWPRLGQLGPGDELRFAEVDLTTARTLRAIAERNLALTANGIQLQGN